MKFIRWMLLLLAAGCASNGGDSQSKSSVVFRVMTYNIHHGEGMDGKVDTARIAELIKNEKADIVALQEVDRGVQRTQRRDLPGEFAALTGMSCIFSNNYHFQGGEYGNAVLTRFPITSWTNTHLKMLRVGEQRGVLQLYLKIGGQPVRFMNTHVDYRREDDERIINIEQFFRILDQSPPVPTIFCGDFNDTPDSRVHGRMKERFDDSWEEVGSGNGFSIPVRQPDKRIDYIWHSREGKLFPRRIWVPASEASDHLPVVAEFELKR